MQSNIQFRFLKTILYNKSDRDFGVRMAHKIKTTKKKTDMVETKEDNLLLPTIGGLVGVMFVLLGSVLLYLGVLTSMDYLAGLFSYGLIFIVFGFLFIFLAKQIKMKTKIILISGLSFYISAFSYYLFTYLTGKMEEIYSNLKYAAEEAGLANYEPYINSMELLKIYLIALIIISLIFGIIMILLYLIQKTKIPRY